MPHSNHQTIHQAANLPPHAASLLKKIAAVEAALEKVTQYTLVWDDDTKQLKRRKLQLRDELAALTRPKNS